MSHELETDLGFSPAEIAECLAREGLLSLELEFTKKCNLRCVYCYSSAGEALEGELTPEEIVSVIEQARGLGARKVVLLGGGEPFLFPHVAEIVRHIHSAGLSQAVFTNGMLLDEPICRLLFECGVTVAIKHNSFRPEVQDDLAGVPGAHRLIQRGLRLLMEAGYPAEGRSLCVQSVICPQNRDEIETLWVWARERGITPYVEVLTNQGRARAAPGPPPAPRGAPCDLPQACGDRPRTIRRAVGPTAAHRRIHLPPPSVQLPRQFAGLRAAVHRRGSTGRKHPRKTTGRYSAKQCSDPRAARDLSANRSCLPGVRVRRGMLRMPGECLPGHRRLPRRGSGLLGHAPP